MGRPKQIDTGISHVKDVVMPQVRSLAGCMGLSLLADRRTGLCIVTTSWESELAMRATAQTMKPIRAAAAEAFGGETTYDEWEIAYLHRDHRSGDGACARVTWCEADPGQLGRVVDAFRLATMPQLEDLPGFCSASVLINRAVGRCCLTVSYDSPEAMKSSRERAMGLRDDLARDTRLELTDVEEFELVLAHLDVPELV
jgi:hypothetical protein